MSKENISFEHFDPDLELGKILDANGKPIKLRKKPGRKPNPPSPAQRKAQNRAAQRAFRERKRQEMREAELTVQQCMEAKNQALNELDDSRKRMEELEFENQYLKGYALTLKLTCFAHKIQVPSLWNSGTTDETGAEEMSFSKTEGMPQQLEFFLDKNKNIIQLDLSEEQLPPSAILESPLSSSLSSSSSSDLFSDIHSDMLQNTGESGDYVLDDTLSTIAPQLAGHLETPFFQQLLKTDLVVNYRSQQTRVTEESKRCVSSPVTDSPNNYNFSPQVFPPMASLDAIEKVRSVKNLNENTRVLFTPTELQRTVRHDTRIDVIPCAALRDNMILFQDFYNANELFGYLTENAIFVGGELGDLKSWFVPQSFFNQYWFLFPNHTIDHIHYQVNSTRITEMVNQRRRMYRERDVYCDYFPTVVNTKENQQLINDILFEEDDDATMDYYSQFLEDESLMEDDINVQAPLDFMALLNSANATTAC